MDARLRSNGMEGGEVIRSSRIGSLKIFWEANVNPASRPVARVVSVDPQTMQTHFVRVPGEPGRANHSLRFSFRAFRKTGGSLIPVCCLS